MRNTHEDRAPPTLAEELWNMVMLKQKCSFSSHHLETSLHLPHGTWYLNPVTLRSDGKTELNVQEMYWGNAYQRKWGKRLKMVAGWWDLDPGLIKEEREDRKEVEEHGLCANLVMVLRAQIQGPAAGDLRGAFPLAAQSVIEWSLPDYASPQPGPWDWVGSMIYPFRNFHFQKENSYRT